MSKYFLEIIFILKFTRQADAKVWINELMDHAVDLEADSVINEHLRNIESLILDPSPEGFGLSSRYCFAFHYDMLFLVL